MSVSAFGEYGKGKNNLMIYEQFVELKFNIVSGILVP